MSQMTKIYFEDNYVRISYCIESRLIEVVWKDTNVDCVQYQLSLSKALVVFKQFDLRNWIIDVNKRITVSNEEIRWTQDYLIPNLLGVGLDCIAFIINPTFTRKQCDALLEIANIKQANVRFFFSSEEAFQWIESSIIEFAEEY
jgi:hypothetical protein